MTYNAPEISPSTKVVRKKDILCSDLGSNDPSVVVLDAERSVYFGMESVAGRIWELIAEKRRVEDVVIDLVEEYEINPLDCERDTLSFLKTLGDKGLVDFE